MEDYEKKYKEVLERAKKLYGKYCINNVLESLFPELKKSKDEKIKKDIIHILKGELNYTSKEDANKYIAWLEKQGKCKDIFSIPTRETILSIWELGNDWKDITHGSSSTKYGTQLEYIQKHWQESEYYLEKQSKQKPVVDFKAKDWYVSKVDGKIHDMTYNPTDRVEPKFKVGDWVVTSYGKVNQVIAIDEDGDGFTLDDNTYFSGSWKDSYHLWTIQDAKDGDVLATDNGVCIFNGTLEEGKYPLAYCGITARGFDFYNVDLPFSNDNNIHPATKEQHDLLFQKMREAGYEWNANKKELRKIEQKPTDKVEPKFKVGDWVVQENIGVYKIIEVCESWYEVVDNKDKHYSIGFDKEYMCHLWTIQDAKEGDILAGKIDGDNYILIFKTIKDGWIETYGHYYDAVDRFCVPSQLFCRDYHGSFVPATKEQEELLLSKMKEGGYEFDFDKKELKKIEQKPTWSSEDKSALEDIEEAITNYWHGDTQDILLDWLKRLKDRIGG